MISDTISPDLNVWSIHRRGFVSFMITAKYSIFNEFDILNAKSLFLCNSFDPAVCRSTAAFVFHAMSLRHATLFSN